MGNRPTRIGSIPTRAPARVPTRGREDRPVPHREALPVGTLLQGGAYRILDVIGAGGFSLTYVAEERSRGVRVAIKEFFPGGCIRRGLEVVAGAGAELQQFRASLEDFVREGQLIKFFNHPSIVQCYSPFEENSTGYMAMELLQGESLLHQLGRRGAMNQQQALEMGHQLGGALDLIHAGGVIHSDIKPENIVYTEQGRFILLDFGVSRRQNPARASKASVVAVSPGYSPPEQYQASRPLTPATDVYSLAATLFTLLGMQILPDAPSREKGAVLPDLRDLNPTVSARFWEVLREALSLEPQQRPQTVEEFISRLTGPTAAGSSVSGLAAAQTDALRIDKLIEFGAHKRPVDFLMLHSHYPVMITGARDGQVGLWSWQGELMAGLCAHERPVCGLAASPDGILLATAGEGGEVKIWNLADAQLLLVVRNGLPAVRALAFSARQVVAVATADGTIEFYEPGQNRPRIEEAHAGGVSCLSTDPSGTLLASGGHDGLVQMWDFSSGRKLAQFSGHNRPILQVQFSGDAKLLVSSSNDYTTKVWELQSGLELRSYRERTSLVNSASFTSDPDLVVTAGADKKLRLYRISTGRLVGQVEADSQYLRSVACHASHPVLATAGGDGSIRVWSFGE